MRVLLLGAGGAAGVGCTRALHDAGHYVIGTDCTDHGLLLSEADENHPLPPPGGNGYEQALWQLVQKADFVHAQPDQEVLAISRLRAILRGKYMLPSHTTVRICQDKWESYRAWKDMGITVPETWLVRGRESLHSFIQKHGNAWLRRKNGAGGDGAIATDSYEFAIHWMNRQQGWGEFTIAQVLTAETVTWQALYRHGELMACQQRKRSSWANARNIPSGISGSTGIGETCLDPQAEEVGKQAILAIDPKAHGLFGVDMAYDSEGVPNPTEINVGRFFTTASEFFLRAGFNFPDYYLRAGLGEELPARLNPIPPGKKWLRVMDREPLLV